MSEDKEYVGTLALGASTSTQDREGEVVETKPVPELSEADIRGVFEKFRGDFYQMPPMVSAKKHGGVPLYKLARQGKVVEREPRFVHVYRYSIDKITLPEIDFSVLCSKGFYVRTYAHDIGETLGCGAHLKSLRRTKSGRFDVADAITVQPPAPALFRQLRLLDPVCWWTHRARACRHIPCLRSSINPELSFRDRSS